MLKQMILCLSLCCVSGWAGADVVAPDVLIDSTIKDVITIVKQDKDIRAGDQKKILALVDAKILPHFDFERMTRLAVGRNWRAATPDQRQALVAEFRDMLVRTYTKVFMVYHDEKIEVKPLKMGSDDTEVTVNTIINKPGSQIIPVDYEMEKTDQGWKVFDMSIEGVSMVMNYRGTFDSQIQQGGIDGLIKTLSDKNKALADADLRKTDAK